jgi:hypothetical protein
VPQLLVVANVGRTGWRKKRTAHHGADKLRVVGNRKQCPRGLRVQKATVFLDVPRKCECGPCIVLVARKEIQLRDDWLCSDIVYSNPDMDLFCGVRIRPKLAGRVLLRTGPAPDTVHLACMVWLSDVGRIAVTNSPVGAFIRHSTEFGAEFGSQDPVDSLTCLARLTSYL